jgi:ribonuclease Z
MSAGGTPFCSPLPRIPLICVCRMNAQNVILTHFSNRYPQMSGNLFNNAEGPTITVAFDHARFRVGDLWKFSRYMSAIEQTVKGTTEEDDEEEQQQILRASTSQ